MNGFYVTLFDDLMGPALPPPRVRLRVRRYECARYVRKVKGEKYQVRVWLAGHGSVNCGLYDERTAEEVALRLGRVRVYPVTPLVLWKALKTVLAELRRERWGNLPDPEPLPRYVERVEGGFAASVKRRGGVVSCPGPYPSPEAAHVALCAELDRLAEAARPVEHKRVSLVDHFRESLAA